jgi:DNA-directed RNA polymerase subunit RPC12/RpoP
MIHFQCSTCAAPFDVDEKLAGRTARCKKCGGRMKIPAVGAAPARATAPRPLAVAVAAGPRLTPINAAAAAPRPQPSMVGRPTNWLDAVTSQVALAPISMDGMQGLRGKSAFVDEPSIPGPYKLGTAPSLPALQASRGKPAGAVTRGYRGAMGKVQKLFRWLNESAYLVSVPFIMCLLLGLAVGNHSLVVLGATVVVVLNIGRIVAGVANLVVIPFRESPIQGILFLIPPITFFYLYQNWHKVHRPVKRIVGPILTLALVAGAFLIEPALRTARTTEGSLQERAKAGVGTLKTGVREQVGKVPNLSADDLKGLQNKAEGAVKSLNAEDALRAFQGRLQDAQKAIQNQAPSEPR